VNEKVHDAKNSRPSVRPRRDFVVLIRGNIDIIYFRKKGGDGRKQTL